MNLKRIAGVIALVLLVIAPSITNAATTEEVVVPFLPETLDGQTVYVTPHIELDADDWEVVRPVSVAVRVADFPSFHSYRYEIWDEGNRPHYDHRAVRLTDEYWQGDRGDLFEFLLSTIDPTDDPEVRLVLFAGSEDRLNQSIVPLGEFETMNERAIQEGYPVATFTISRSFDSGRLLIYVLSGIVFVGFLISLGLSLRKPKHLVKAFRMLTHPKKLVRLSSKERMHLLAHLVVVLILSAGVYGVVLGTFTGGVQVLYVLLKLPIVLLAALLISFLSGWILTRAIGSEQSVRDAFLAAIAALTGLSLALLSLSVVLALFLLNDPTHDAFLSVNALLFGLAGFLGAAVFVRFQRAVGGNRLLWPRVLIWLGLYGLVVLQVGWMLRPWVGLLDPGQEVPLLRLFTGNAFEELLRALLRALTGGGL